MLALYHWEPNGASARVLITLKEKGIAFESRYVDVLAFEQLEPAFLKMNEMGQTPVLVNAGGQAMNESSYVCEYLDEAFPEGPLMPRDPAIRQKVRAWQKYVDDHVAASVSELAWQAYGAPQLQGRDRAAIDRAVAGIEIKERRDVWTAAVAGHSAETLDKARGRARDAVAKMEADLQATGWLAGADFSLADIAAYAYVNYLPRLMPEAVNTAATPRSMAWLKRVSERPGVKAALAMARTPDPYAIAAPGPEQVQWG